VANRTYLKKETSSYLLTTSSRVICSWKYWRRRVVAVKNCFEYFQGSYRYCTYLWRSLWVISKLLPIYVKWSSLQERTQSAEDRNTGGCQRIFQNCVGFLGGSIIILRDNPQVDPEAYFSRKKEYGINLQAICDWNRRFIYVSMGYTAAAHDSTAFKNSNLYKNRTSYFNNHEYLLAD